MKNNMHFVVFLAAIIFVSCGEGENHDNHAMSSDKDTSTANSGAVTNAPAKFKQQDVDAVYQHYVHLTNALIKEDVADARLAATAINAGSKDLAGGEILVSTSKKIMETSSIDEQRKAFADLSNEFIAYARKTGMQSGEVYVDFCPMAMENKGAYWLSSKKEIANPYYGDDMLTCGEIKETLK